MSIVKTRDDDSGCSTVHRSATVDDGYTFLVTKQRNILVIEDSRTDFRVIQISLEHAEGVSYKVEHARRLSDGLERLVRGGIHLVLLDLNLPDSMGLATFQTAFFHAPNVPIIVLSGLDDRTIAVDAVTEGAQDYLIKGELSTESLVRSISYARARHRIQADLAQALQAAQTSEANLYNIISGMVEGMIVIDGEGMVQFSNKAARRLFGRTPDVLNWLAIDLVLADGQASEFELARSDGETVPVDVHTVEIDWEGKPARLAILRDLTTQKRAEADRLKRQEAESKINSADDLQQRLFPPRAPSVEGFDIAGAVFSAGRGSGDCFDFVSMPDDNICVAVGDVSGHGLVPAMMMIQTRSYLRALLSECDDPGMILSRTNQHLLPSDHGKFVTMLLGRINPRTRSFLFASAGHEAYRLTRNGNVTTLDSTGMVLGVLEDERIATAPELALESGDVILVPTDGVFEAHAPDGTLLGTSRMLDVVHANRDKPAHEIVHALYQTARDFTENGRQADDITIVVIKVE
jgi:DNA-binding NarL/FixJ family response regulator